MSAREREAPQLIAKTRKIVWPTKEQAELLNLPGGDVICVEADRLYSARHPPWPPRLLWNKDETILFKGKKGDPIGYCYEVTFAQGLKSVRIKRVIGSHPCRGSNPVVGEDLSSVSDPSALMVKRIPSEF